MLVTVDLQGQHTSAAPSRPLSQEVDLSITYTAQQSNLVTGSDFWRQGGSVELSAVAFKSLGIAANVTGSRIANIQGTGINLTSVTTTFGPRYIWLPRSGRYAVFGQGLLGEFHGLDSFSLQPGAYKPKPTRSRCRLVAGRSAAGAPLRRSPPPGRLGTYRISEQHHQPSEHVEAWCGRRPAPAALTQSAIRIALREKNPCQ